MKTFLYNLLGIAVYAVLFLILILLIDLGRSVKFDIGDIGLSLILSLFFGILNEIHRDLTKMYASDCPTKKEITKENM